MNMIIGIVLIFAVLFQARAQFSQPGELDSTFNFGRPHSFFTNPSNPEPGEAANGIVRCLAQQPGGKVIIGGDFTSYNGTLCNRIARINANGLLDSTFNLGLGADNKVYAVVVQPDGKVVIGGDFTSYQGVTRNRIARLNSNGILDTTFNPVIGSNNSVRSIVIQADGKIIIGGIFTQYNGSFRNRLARLNSNGSLDTTFSMVSGVFGSIQPSVNSMLLQSDGKLVIVGSFSAYNGVPRNRIARINANGSLDMSFNPGLGANDRVLSSAMQPDGKIIIAGNFTSYDGITRNRVARLNQGGSLDTTFNPGTGANFWVTTLALFPNGKILIGGVFTSYNGTSRSRIARLNTEGSLDITFDPGEGSNAEIFTSVVQPDGKALVGGGFDACNGIARNRIARLNADGKLDGTFNKGTGASNTVFSIAQQIDGKLIIGGGFTSFNDTSRNKIARINSDGTLDTSFNQGKGFEESYCLVYSVACEPGGKILVGGDFDSYNGVPRRNIARLNQDGSLDTTFNPGLGASSHVYSFAIQPDGKILIGGCFTSYNGVISLHIARLNADGSLDTTFYSVLPITASVSTIQLQPDGKIIIGGTFFAYNGTSRNNICRLNTDGSLDSSFNPGTGANSWVNSIAIQPDGKVIIGGWFTNYNGYLRNRISRLNNDGSLDTSFNPGTGADNYISSLALQLDGKVLISGYFDSYNGEVRNGIARLNADGSLDTTFNSSMGASIRGYTLAIQPNGRLVIGGGFTSINGLYRPRIARVLTEAILVSIPEETTIETFFELFPNPFIHSFRINARLPFRYYIYTIEGKIHATGFSSSPELSLSTSAWPSGTYILRIITEEGVSVRKLVKE